MTRKRGVLRERSVAARLGETNHPPPGPPPAQATLPESEPAQRLARIVARLRNVERTDGHVGQAAAELFTPDELQEDDNKALIADIVDRRLAGSGSGHHRHRIVAAQYAKRKKPANVHRPRPNHGPRHERS